jgi:hypothetical protein
MLKKKIITVNFPKFLKIENNYLLKRIGKKNDGGYLVDINSIIKSKTLISLGINDDWSFEKDFANFNSKANIVCFDKDTSLIFLIKIFLRKFIFIFYYGLRDTYASFIKIFNYINFLNSKLYKKNISYKDLLNISKKLKEPFFLKIDIEGSEYRILNDIVKIQKKISGIVIEFHNIDLFLTKIEEFIKKIDLKLVHIHANNYGILYDETNVVELTFARNPTIINKKVILPNILDQPNNSKLPEIKIKFK